jgi:hypothetical protein
LSQGGAEAAGSWRGEIVCWALALAAVAYAFAVQQGLGPAPGHANLRWYEPSGFLSRWDALAWSFATSRRVILVFTLPAALLAAGVFVSGRSALARALALSSLVASLLFAFYGDVAVRVWEFFHWRASAVIAVTGLVLGFALAAPSLARSWLALSWPLRLAVYLPVCLLVVAFMRNATGTNVNLRFAISPWPAVPVFGIEVGALFVMVWLMGAALGVLGIARMRSGGGPGWIALGVAAGIGLPVALVAAGSALSLLPFRAGAGTLAGVAAACALAIALSGLLGRAEALSARARHLGVGALLIAVPLLSGEVWARFDYYWTRQHRAQQLIDAMQRYYDKEQIFPDELSELVEDGYLEALPEPAIGFGFLYDEPFRYRSFGTSYILEFPAPRWVECAYSPPYEEEDEEAAEEEDGGDLEAWETADYAKTEGEGDDEALGGAWSCPEKPPELW